MSPFRLFYLGEARRNVQIPEALFSILLSPLSDHSEKSKEKFDGLMRCMQMNFRQGFGRSGLVVLEQGEQECGGKKLLYKVHDVRCDMLVWHCSGLCHDPFPELSPTYMHASRPLLVSHHGHSSLPSWFTYAP